MMFALLALTLILPPVPPPTWVWPTEGPEVILRDFRAPSTPWGPGHRGLDLAASSPEVLAPASGVVSFSGFVVDRGVLSITTAEGLLISMEPVTALVAEGSTVQEGDLIATLDPGHCERLCLHLGVRDHGAYRSARAELGVLQRAVLLPVDTYARG
jgi:murein DD-endopeptidase MepM/ murein hydrolase activator NlpD